MKHFTKQNSSLCILHGTIGIQINNIVYTLSIFLKTLPLQKIVPNLKFIIWNFFSSFYLNIVLLALYLPEEMKCDAEFWK